MSENPHSNNPPHHGKRWVRTHEGFDSFTWDSTSFRRYEKGDTKMLWPLTETGSNTMWLAPSWLKNSCLKIFSFSYTISLRKWFNIMGMDCLTRWYKRGVLYFFASLWCTKKCPVNWVFQFLGKRLYFLSAGDTVSTTGVECSDDVPGTGVRNSSLLEALLELSWVPGIPSHSNLKA